MTTAREWLVERNLAKPGVKGRFSLAAKQALADAIAAGTEFEDYGEVEVKNPRGKKKVLKTRPKADRVDISNEAEAIYSPRAKFYAFVDGKRVETSPKNACMNSGYSLTYCMCVVSGFHHKHKAIVKNEGYMEVEVEGL